MSNGNSKSTGISDGNSCCDDKSKFIGELLNSSIIEEDVLRKIGNTGIPHEHRAVAYKVLLGVLSRNKSLHMEQEEAHLRRYLSYFSNKNEINLHNKSEFNLPNKETVNSLDKSEINSPDKASTDLQPTHRYDLHVSEYILNLKYPKALKDQIQIDLNRIKLEHRIYNKKDYTFIYMDILIITSVQRPIIEYIQGMADLIIPFFHLFIPETLNSNDSVPSSNIFQCFGKILSKIEIDLQSMQSHAFLEIENFLKIFDFQIFEYFKSQEIEISMFCSRWLHCIFIREFSIENWFRIFDSMVSTNISKFLILFSVSLIRFLKFEILSSEGCDAIILLQNVKSLKITINDVNLMIGEVNYMLKEVKLI